MHHDFKKEINENRIHADNREKILFYVPTHQSKNIEIPEQENTSRRLQA